MRIHHYCRAGWCAAVALGLAAPAAASCFYANTFGATSELWRIETAGGSAALIGTFDISSVTDLAFSPTEVLYACTGAHLYTVDPTDASTSLVGAFGTTINMVGLDFASDGTLWGVDQANGNVFTINVLTGAAQLEFTTAFIYVGDAAHAGGDLLYASASDAGGSRLIELDTAAQTAVDRGVIAAGGIVAALDFDASSDLYAAASNGNVFHIPSPATSGAGVFQSDTDVVHAGLTTVPPCREDVNGDGTINVLDLIELLLCFGLPATAPCHTGQDVNCDGTINVLDLIELLLQFGQACP